MTEPHRPAPPSAANSGPDEAPAAAPIPTPASGAASTRRQLLWIGAAAVGAGAAVSWWRGGAGGSARPASASGDTAGGGNSSTASTTGPGSNTDPASVSDESRLAEDFWSRPIQAPDGADLPLASWRGRPLLLNFWATWCPPCLREMPMLDAAWRQWSDRGLVVLGLAIDSPGPVRSYLDKTPVAFPIGMAGAFGTAFSKQLGNRMGGLPYSVLADGSGKIIQRHTGELKAEDVDRWIAALGFRK